MDEDQPELNQTPDQGSNTKPPISTLVGLVIAFVPSVLVHLFRHTRQDEYLWLAFSLSVVCCSISSFLLVRHRIIKAMILALVLFILNVVISLFLGCGALIGGPLF